MKINGLATRLLVIASVQVGASDFALADWVTINLSSYANARIQGYQPGAAGFPEGPVVLGGVPFNIQLVGGNNAWNAEVVTGPYPHTLDVPINVSGATEVQTLINTFYGQPGPTSYIALEFFGSKGAYHKKDLIGNVDVRDHFQAHWTNTINNTTTINVFSTGGGHLQDNRLDKQQIVLPAEFGCQTLTSMRLTSTGGVLISDASIQGLTIGKLPNPPCGQENSPCATLLVNGVGAVGSGPFTVTSFAGGSLVLTWSGSANQPLLLLGSMGLDPGQNFGGPLIFDLDLATTAILFSGFEPVWGALFFTNAASGNYGTATQSVSVPPTVSGLSIALQGVVFDSQHNCPGPGYRTTASFLAQF